MKTLVFITDTYPLGGITEQAFIRPEIEPLARNFNRVIFMPVNPEAAAESGPGFERLTMPDNVEIDLSLLSRPTALWKASHILHPLLLKHLSGDFTRIKSWKSFRHFMAFSAYTLYYRNLLKHLIKEKHIDCENTLFYTFWFDAATTALASIPGVKIVSRAHGHDIYNLRPRFISPSWRQFTMRHIAMVYTASKAGENYLKEKFPEYEKKFVTRFLGSRSPETLNPPAPDNDRLVLLSCSRLAEGKGVELQLELLGKWARRHPERKILWICIGYGPLEQHIRSLAEQLPPNISAEFIGKLKNEAVHKLLSTRHIDASLLLSESEGGTPIAMLEALSYGVPIITTRAGGLSEITAQSGGLLLSQNPSEEEFCEKFDSYLPKLPHKRKPAADFFQKNFNAEHLREAFARELAAFIS